MLASFHQVSGPYVNAGPGFSELPPTAVALGESAGTAIVFALPSRHVLPLSPAPLRTLTPARAAFWKIVSMLLTSVDVVWSSQ